VQFLAILTAIEVEASHCHQGSASTSKLGNKGRELKKVGVFQPSYDSKGESSSCGKGKERGLSVFNEA
jgi:hypothetical protein